MFNVKNLPTKDKHSKETASIIFFLVLNQIQSDDVYFEGNRYFGFSNKASFILWLPNILQQVCFSLWLMMHYSKYLYVNVGRLAQSV